MESKKQSSTIGLLLSHLPLNAKVIVEIGHSPLEDSYRHYNPHVSYWHVDAPIAAEAMPQAEVDCLVWALSPGDAAHLTEAIKVVMPWLAPGGQILLGFSNAQFWQRLVGLLLGQWDNPDCFTLSSIQRLGSAAGLTLQEVILDQNPLPAAHQESFATFHRQITPLLETLQISPESFQRLTQSDALLLRGLGQSLTQPKLLIQTCITAPVGCDRVRVLEPDRFTNSLLATRTMNIRVGESIRLNLAMPDEEKVFVWQRALLYYPKDIQKQRLLMEKGYLIVAEHDDDPYFWPENADNKFLLFWSSHCIQTSTPALAEHLKQFGNPFIQVFRNHLAYLPPPREYPETYTVNLFFGALNRQQDWEPLMPILNRVLTRHKQVFVHVVHDRQFFDALATSRKQFQPFLPYESYQQVLHSCDIGILPLQDTQFNRMKSDLKFLEHGGHGVVALASPTVYQDSILEGVTGMIYRSPEEFGEKLSELIQNAPLRRTLATNAYEWVKENRLLCQHFAERRSWYLEMRAQLPQLNAALKERCPVMFEP